MTKPAIISRHDQSGFDSGYIRINFKITYVTYPYGPYDMAHIISVISSQIFVILSFYVALPKYAFWNILLFKNIILVWYASRVIFSVWHGKYPYRIGSWCIKFRTRSEFWISDWSGLWLVNWKSSKALAE